jgi:bacitracin transport system ATP-binding protein
MNDFVIETKQLTKNYGEQTVVNSVNLHVKKGRIYGLLDVTGSRKDHHYENDFGVNPYYFRSGRCVRQKH